MARTVIRGGKRVSSSGVHTGDIAFEKGIITDVAGYIDLKGDDILINAQGYYVLPGLIDGLTFIEFDNGLQQSIDTWESSTRAAAAGGITSVIVPVVKDAKSEWVKVIENTKEATYDAVVDFCFHGILTDYPAKKQNVLAPLSDEHVHSLLLYTSGLLRLNDAQLLRVLREAAEQKILVLLIAENNDLIVDASRHLASQKKQTPEHFPNSHPVEAEWEAIHRVLFFAELSGASVCIVSCTASQSLELVQKARSATQPAIAGSHLHYLLLDAEQYSGERPDHFICAPPLRTSNESAALWEALKTNTLTLITSGSIDYSLRQRADATSLEDMPAGLPTMELMLPLLYTNGIIEKRLALPELVKLLCETPARLFGLDDRKGFLEEGHDADIVLYDPEAVWTVSQKALHHVSDISPFEGLRLEGKVVTTISRGQVISQNGEVVGRRGHGRFLERKPVHLPDLL